MDYKRKEFKLYRQSVARLFSPFLYFCQMYLLQSNLLQKLEQLDQWLFIEINNHQSNSFFDAVMPLLRNSFTWAPLYIFLLFFITLNFKKQGHGWWWVLIFLCTVSLTDMLSSKLIKESFERLRPCADPDFFVNVRLLVNRCSGGYSFTSSHAANHFGMAAFMFFTLQSVIKRWAWLAFLWAAIICYAQVYVGVHYPFDVLCGSIVGFVFGRLLAIFFNKRFGFVNFE
jgi:membrane-associated phospholipid phosphatase